MRIRNSLKYKVSDKRGYTVFVYSMGFILQLLSLLRAMLQSTTD